MKIAHVIRRLSFDDWGGTEQVVWNLAKAQSAAGHEVRIFSTTALCGTRHEKIDKLDILRFRPIYPWWPMPARLVAELDRKGGNPFVPGLGRALREWGPDVIHCHAMARIAELCLRTAKKIGAKSVVSLHGGGANVPKEEARSLKSPTRWRVPWGKMIDYAMGWTRRVPEDFDGIVCVGEDECDKYGKRHPHVLYLPNGVDAAAFAVLDRAKSVPSGRARRILCVARIDRQKNQMLLVELLARHPEATLRLVGPVTQPDYKEELEARARELGVAGRLAIVGALKPGSAELLGEYTDADMFILPSRHEPFGIAALEAWAAGTPVIASDIGGLGRLCAAHPGAALTFSPGDLNALDDAYHKLAESEEMRKNLSRNGRNAAKDYDWSVLATKLVGFYKQI